MISNFLKAKYYWERSECELAFYHLNEVLTGDGHAHAIYWTQTEVGHEMQLPFEIAVTNLLLTEGALALPFNKAFVRLWKALPLQYLVLVVFQRTQGIGRNMVIGELFSQAAICGLLSTNINDYDLSGKVVLNPTAYPLVVELLGGEFFIKLIEQATAESAWQRLIAPDAALVINLFLYAVFHRERPLHGEMILVRLERIANSQGLFLQTFSNHLRALFAEVSLHESLVSIGMRIDQLVNASLCLKEFDEALVSRQFEPFVRRYFRVDN